MACLATKTITILRRSTMTTLYQKEFSESRLYFENLFVMSMEDKGQEYVFYTMSSNEAHRIGMFEILIDEAKPDAEQLVIDWGELAVPQNEANQEADNYGPIRLGGGANYLLTTRETFDVIKGYTICPYDKVLKDEGSTVCSTIS